MPADVIKFEVCVAGSAHFANLPDADLPAGPADFLRYSRDEL